MSVVTNIITLLWGLLAGLRRTNMRAAALAGPREPRASRVAPARPQSNRSRNDNPILDPAAIEHAMAQLLSLFAQWQSGTLPPQAESAPRYIPHPSWHPIWLRRRRAPPPAPEPKRAPRRIPMRQREAPARALAPSRAPDPPRPLPHPGHVRQRPSHQAAPIGRAVPRPQTHLNRVQAPTLPTP